MPRRSKTKTSLPPPTPVQQLAARTFEKDEWYTPDTKHNPDTWPLTDDSVSKVIRDSRKTSDTTRNIKQTKHDGVVCQNQNLSKSAKLESLSTTLKSGKPCHSISDSDQNLVAACGVLETVNLADKPHSHSRIEAPSGSQRIVLDRPETIASMLNSPATVLGTIGILPAELLEMVFDNLSWDAAIHLAAVNRYYRSIIKPDFYGSRGERARFLRSQESKPKYSSYKKGKSWFGCTGCWCLKLEKRFCLTQVTGPRHRKGAKSWRERRCLACEIKLGRYKVSEIIENGASKTMKLCKSCKEFRGGLHCLNCGLCEGCMGTLRSLRCPRCNYLPTVPPEAYWNG